LLIGSSAAVLVLAVAAAYGSNGPGAPTVTTVAISSAPARPATIAAGGPTELPTTSAPTPPATVAQTKLPLAGTAGTATQRPRTTSPGTGSESQKTVGPAPGGGCGAPANPFGYTFCGGSTITRPVRNVCSYFHCTSSFWDGQGYMVLCQDGTVSLSGGRRWACSAHHGARRPVFRRS
jgi:hypothetical protein